MRRRGRSLRRPAAALFVKAAPALFIGEIKAVLDLAIIMPHSAHCHLMYHYYWNGNGR